MLDGLRGQHSVAVVEPGKRRLVGDTSRAATSSEVTGSPGGVEEVVAEQALELRLLKKSMIADGDGEE